MVVVIAAVSIGAMVMVRRRMSGAYVIGRQVARAEPATVAEATPGSIVRLTGVIRAVGEAPTSEASGRAFVARDLRIVTHTGDGGSPTRPARQSIDFLLDDGTAVALVRATGAAVAIDRDVEMPQTTLDQAMWLDPILRAGGYHNGSPQTCKVRVYEGVLGPGDRISVIGMVATDDGLADQLGATITITGSDLPVTLTAPAD